jgi:hypothetical protein
VAQAASAAEKAQERSQRRACSGDSSLADMLRLLRNERINIGNSHPTNGLSSAPQ